MAADEQFINIEGGKVRRSSRSAGGGGGGGELWRAVAAEAAGSALLVAGSCLPAAYGAPPAHAALAAAAVVAMLVQCFDQVSGALLNPALALAGALRGRVRWRRAALYLPAQLAGAALGSLAVNALARGGRCGDEACACALCVSRPAAGLGGARAALLEAALSACLALANCAHWDARAAQLAGSWPLRAGAVVAALGLAAGEATGASMNPARSLGPALCAGHWDLHWVYWVGPLGGALAASLLYRALWSCPPPPAPRPPSPPPPPAPAR